MGEENDPLENWLMMIGLPSNKRDLSSVRASLNQIEKALAAPPDVKQRLDSLLPWFPILTPLTLPPSDRERAQQLVVQIARRGASARGGAKVEEFLLNAIGFTQAPESLPFWQALLDLKVSRDRFASRRRQFALAALALLAIRQASPAAYAVLDAAIQHANEQVRAHAAYYLGSAYAIPGRPLPEHVLAALHACASNDPAFEVRYQARMTLRYLGLPVPLDNPDGAYIFKVQLRGDPSGATRTIALLPEQTLEELHFAIQEAFEWDADHLYSFFLRGKEFDHSYEIPGPEGDPFFGALFRSDPLLLMEEDEEDEESEEDEEDEEDTEPLDATTAAIGELGLRVGHKLLYYFDYGDDNKFDVTLIAVHPQAEPGEYPRLVESFGEAPPQYLGDDSESGFSA